MLEHSEKINEIAAALAKAQGEMVNAKKDSTATIQGKNKKGVSYSYEYDYTNLAGCLNSCRSPLSKNGLSFIQSSGVRGNQVSITSMLLHSSGQYFKNTITLTSGDQDPQSIGSAITYGRRYELCAMVGIAPEDDDGKAASKAQASPQQRKSHKNKNQTSNGYAPSLQDGIREAIINECNENECSEHWKISQESLLKEGYFNNPLAKELFKTLAKKWEDGLEKDPPEITEPMDGESNVSPKTEKKALND